MQEPELALKRIAASALSDIAKHTPELAQAVVDAGAVAYLSPLIINQDAKLKRQVGGLVTAPWYCSTRCSNSTWLRTFWISLFWKCRCI